MWSLFLIGQFFFKWLILRFILENGHQKATYYGEIRLDVIKVFTTF